MALVLAAVARPTLSITRPDRHPHRHARQGPRRRCRRLRRRRTHVIDLLQQRARPSLFSNALPAPSPPAPKKHRICQREPQRVARLHANVRRIREGLSKLGFQLHDSPTAIIPIMIGDEAEAIAESQRLLDLGVLVIGFGLPRRPQRPGPPPRPSSAALEDAHIGASSRRLC